MLGSWRMVVASSQMRRMRGSPNQHASKHYAATGHPVITSFEPGERWFYDYRTEQFSTGPKLPAPHCHPLDQPVPGPAGAVPSNWQTLLPGEQWREAGRGLDRTGVAPITCGSPRREGGRRLLAADIVQLPRPNMRRPDQGMSWAKT